MKRNKKLLALCLSVVTAALMLAVLAACKNTADGDDRGGNFGGGGGGQTEPGNVRYEPNGAGNVRGLPIDPRIYKAGDTVPLPEAEPERDGYVFLGWSTIGEKLTATTKDGKEVQIEGGTFKSGSTKNANIQGNIKSFKMPPLKEGYIYFGLMAQREKAFNITYNLNGGKNPVDAQNIYVYNEGYTLPTPTRAGCNFAGWYTNSNFSGTSVSEITAYSSENKTFYAKWSLIQYSITYNLNDGSISGNKKDNYTVEDAAYTLPTPTKNGYTFMGWYTDSSFNGNAVTNIAAGSTGNKTFYAKWSPIPYSITYNLNGGSNASGAKTSYTVEDSYTLPTPTKTYRKFMGWYTDSNFSDSTKVTQITTGSTGNKTFYARWVQAAVGDIILKDGSLCTPDEYVKDSATAVAVIVRPASGNAPALGVGIKHADLAWCTGDANGYDTNIRALQGTTGSGFMDGSTGLEKLQAACADAKTSLDKYPVWKFCTEYGTTNNLTGDLKNGWYLPTMAELNTIYQNKETVEASLTKAGGNTFGSDWYWSSCQFSSGYNYARELDFRSGGTFYTSKSNGVYVCAVRAFN